MKKCENCGKEISDEQLNEKPKKLEDYNRLPVESNRVVYCNSKCEQEDFGKSLRGEKIKPENFEFICKEAIEQINFIKNIAKIIETSPHRKNGKEDADKHRVNYGKLIHKFIVEAKFCMMFGINDSEGAVAVIDTKKLEQGKTLDEATVKDTSLKI